MDYWRSKVLPKIKKAFDKGGKKAAAAEVIKSFDESKEGINSEFEEKKGDLQPKVLEIYEAAPVQVKTLVKERKVAGIKKNSAAVTKFLEDLSNIDFPGARQVSEGISKVGTVLIAGPITATLEKVSTLLPTATEAAAKEAPAASEEVASREVAIEEKKGEAPASAEEATGESAPATSEPSEEAAAPAETVAAEATPAEPELAKGEEEPPKA